MFSLYVVLFMSVQGPISVEAHLAHSISFFLSLSYFTMNKSAGQLRETPGATIFSPSYFFIVGVWLVRALFLYYLMLQAVSMDA